ncbi:MAG: ABC transporter ATP-binding protein [Pseudomonadota bacterium]
MTEPREVAVRIERVVKRFGDVAAVDGVDLEIGAGELFCLLGGSGSGKSTLLRMLAGFEDPDEGRIEIGGRDMAGVDPADRPVNMMFQSYALFPHMSVAENIGYGLRRQGIARGAREERVAEMLRLVRLDGLGARKPHQLSGGQRQRVALARALARRPAVLLLDEPLSALDRKLREDTQFELMGIQEALKTTFIVVTHDQEEAMVLAERIAVMDRGRLAQVGTPRHVYEFPASRFVADFIGTVNLLPARATGPGARPGLVALEVEGLGPVEAAHEGDAPEPGAAVWLALRPEKVTLAREAPDAPPGGFPGVVEDLAYRGDLTQFRIRCAGGARLRVTRPNQIRADEPAIDWDDPVRAGFAPEAALVVTD